jgi:S-adenosyl methyltransferase
MPRPPWSASEWRLPYQALLISSPEGATAYIDADLRDTAAIAERAAGFLDFGPPVAVMLLGILQGIPDQDEPGAIIARLMDAVPPGSYLAISQIASDVAADEVAEGVQRYNEQAAVPVAARTHRSAGSSRGWTSLSPAWCRCTGGGPDRGTWASGATWPFMRGWGGNRNRTAEPGSPRPLARHRGIPARGTGRGAVRPAGDAEDGSQA